ncbi:hypothetical protein [Aquibacillus rhizosphaerae]|uniref:Rod shape-determining protein MreD n=1 Tax=Aquibacillus rhizosphaerae TaxID=3051431 RepID=A0ABT7LB41_9BACI|nr:hypothetical protein [Aquibacillus sp. LR5S19]MDL4843068.1 hypothetical protein [Aquibacillus sp. LR5S19]
MILPENFDLNESFILIGLIVLYSVVIILPKRFPLSITILLITFPAVIARLSDHILSGLLFDMYDVMDSGKFELFDLLTYIFYGPFAYLFIYVYDKFNISGYGTLLYVIVFTIFGTLFEGLNLLLEVFSYKSWHLSYSFTYYLTLQPITIWFYIFIKQTYKKVKTDNQLPI